MKIVRKYTIGTQEFTAEQALEIYADLSKEFGPVVEPIPLPVFVPIPLPSHAPHSPHSARNVRAYRPHNWTAGRN